MEFCDKNDFLLVEKGFNHPSVVAWSVGNELREPKTPWENKVLTKNQYGYVNSMPDYVTTLGSTRLKTYVSITSYRKGELGTEPFEKVDILSMNSYGDAPTLSQKAHEKFPGKPIFISEIGISQIGNGSQAQLSKELIEYLTEFKQSPWVAGVSLGATTIIGAIMKELQNQASENGGVLTAIEKRKHTNN